MITHLKTAGLRGVAATVLLALSSAAAAEPLESWNDTTAREGIVAFVEAVTDPASPDFVPPPERIAVFDISSSSSPWTG